MAATSDARDRVVTLFGGGGFLGRYAVAGAARAPAPGFGSSSATRAGPSSCKPLAAVGQIQFVAADIRDRDRVARRRSRAATPSSTWSGSSRAISTAIHVEGARNVAEAAAAAGASALVHVSAIGADPESRIRLRPEQGRGRGGGPGRLPGRDRSCGPRSCSGARTISSTASRRWPGSPRRCR